MIFEHTGIPSAKAMTDPVDDVVKYLERMDLGKLQKNTKERTTNFVQDVEWEKEKFRARYDDLDARLATIPGSDMAQDLVNFNRFEWKLDWVKIIHAYDYDKNILKAFTECRNVKLTGDEMLTLFGQKPDQVDVFVMTFQRGFYAFDANTTPMHFARLPASMFAAVASSPGVDLAVNVDEILAAPDVCADNKRLVYELFADHWMTKDIPDKHTYIVEFLEAATAVADNDPEFCRLICDGALKLTAYKPTTPTTAP